MPKANPLKPGKTKAAVAANIARLKRDGYPQAQAVAIALREARTPGRSIPRKQNYSYPDIASIKKVLGASVVSRLVNSTYPRLALARAHERYMGKSDWAKAEAVAQLERYVKKAEGRRENPASTSTSSDVRSPTKTSTSTYAHTAGNITVTGGAGAGATTRVVVRRNPKTKEWTCEQWNASAREFQPVYSGTKAACEHTAINIRDKGGIAKVVRTTSVVVRRNPDVAKWAINRVLQNAPKDQYIVVEKNGFIGVPSKSASNGFAQLSKSTFKILLNNGYLNPPITDDNGHLRYSFTGKATRKTNPSVLDISEMFQGDASGKTVELKAANGAPSNLSRAGKLASLKLADRRASVRIPGAVVCIDTKKRLWLAGPRTPMFNRKAAKGEGLDYGEIDTIAYVTAKSHVGNGRTFEYVHNFGEDGGRKPHLIIDDEGMAIIKGGDYQIREEGIID